MAQIIKLPTAAARKVQQPTARRYGIAAAASNATPLPVKWTPPGMGPAAKIAWGAVAIARAKLDARPYRPGGAKPLVLRSPACEHGCAVCYMECAILPERLAWWEREAVTCIREGR